MKTIIDNIINTTGWSASGGASIYNVNEIPEFIAGNNLSSLIVKFNGLNSYVEKTYNVDVTDYKIFTLWISSRVLGNSQDNYIGDFKYKIDLGTGEEFYVQLDDNFSPITLDISNVSTITKIKITALSAVEDYLFLSYAVASLDVFPLDILQSIKEQIEYNRDQFFNQRLIGTITGSIGDKSITFGADIDFIDRYSVIEIDDGNNSEIHHLVRREGNTFTFSGLQDGKVLLNNYTSANVYLYYPVDFGMTQKEISLPSITLWGFSPEKEVVSSEFDLKYDTISVDNQTYQERRTGQFLNWSILIDCEDRESYEVLGELTNIIRIFLGKLIIWVNGRKVNIEYDGTVTELEATENHDIVPKVQYPISVQVKEEIYERQTVYKTETINVDVQITQEDS